MPFLIAFGVLLALLILILLTAYVCFRIAFYLPPRKPVAEDEFPLPPGKAYEEYRDVLEGWMKTARAYPYERVSITSFDGLTLCGKYYEHKKGAPLEILFHGYQGSSDRDLCGGVRRCFALGRNALLVDHRGGGDSQGNVTTFGILERKDCLKWIDFAIEKFGKDVKIILCGISMGAATVLMTAGETLPENVVYVLGDCSYSAPKDIIKKVVKEMRLPPAIFYPFIKLGAKLFGKFDLEETSPVQAIQSCKVPVILFHGDNESLVPCEMSKQIFNACPTPKKLVLIPDAEHGLAYPKDEQTYIDEIRAFEKQCGL